MRRRITGFDLDAEGDWVAELECGHRQHVRHRPPFQMRAWVLEEAGRASRIGAPIDCPLCDSLSAPLPDSLRSLPGDGTDSAEDDGGTLEPGLGGAQATADEETGGEPACWAHLFCPECGRQRGLGHPPDCATEGHPGATG